MKVNNKTKQTKTFTRVKIDPIVLTLIHVMAAFLLSWLLPLPLAVFSMLRTIGFAIVILGFGLGIAALMAFRRTRSTRNSDGLAVRLVTFGVYRFTRNPVYLGFLLMLIGIPLNGGSYWGVLLAPIMVILFDRLVIEREEEYLVQTFGDEYRAYRSRVGRWI